MYKLTVDWSGGEVWPGSETISTTLFMQLRGGDINHIEYGMKLIMENNPTSVEFFKPTAEEELQGLCWRTVLLYADEASANNVFDYYNTKAKEDATTIGYTMVSKLEVV